MRFEVRIWDELEQNCFGIRRKYLMSRAGCEIPKREVHENHCGSTILKRHGQKST